MALIRKMSYTIPIKWRQKSIQEYVSYMSAEWPNNNIHSVAVILFINLIQEKKSYYNIYPYR